MPIRPTVAVCLLFALVAGPTAIRASDAPPAAKKPERLIIDSSRDGGIWWFPQSKDFLADQPHQGRHFADLVKQFGYEVVELPRDGAALDFSGAAVVVRFCFSGEYTDADVATYRAFVESGGRMILVRGFVREERGTQDKVAATFGFNFSRLIRQTQITKFEPHEITQGIVSQPYNTGSIIDARPDGSQALAFTDDGKVVMAVATVGKGRVIAISTPFALLQASEPFAKQLLKTGEVKLAQKEDGHLPAVAARLEAETAAKLYAEKAELTKRLSEINAQLDKLAFSKGVTILGLTLVDPTDDLVKNYQLPNKYPGPIIVEAKKPSTVFPSGMAAFEGCAFWLVEHPAKAFFFNKEQSRPRFPKTVRELAEAIVACTVSPTEYEKIWEDTRKACRERAEALQDKPTERERMLKVAEARMRPEDEGKHICRVVYHYPGTTGRTGTMTTYIRMTKEDLDQVKALLHK